MSKIYRRPCKRADKQAQRKIYLGVPVFAATPKKAFNLLDTLPYIIGDNITADDLFLTVLLKAEST